MFYHLDDTKAINNALIIHSGALGDCVLTLRLAAFMKEALGVSVVNFIGPGDYIGFMPGRTAVSGIRSIHSVKLDRLFTNPAEFEVEENDPLVAAFGNYNWIFSFLGETGSNFETNLAYIACFTSSPELVMLSAKPPHNYDNHISRYHIEEFIAGKLPSIEALGINNPHNLLEKEPTTLICPNVNDIQTGLGILKNKAAVNVTASTDIAIISPGSGGTHKCWHIDNYINTALMLRKQGLEPVFLLGMVELERFEKDKIQKLKTCGAVIDSLTIEQAVCLLSTARLYIGNDSGISHISGAMSIPTVSIFGPTNPRIYRPVGSHSISLSLEPSSFASYDNDAVAGVVETALAAI